MSKNTRRTTSRISQFTKRKQITAENYWRRIQNLGIYNRHDSSNSLQSLNFLRCRRPLPGKSAKQQQRSNAKKQKNISRKKCAVSVGRATVPITPQMIRVAVKELQTRTVFISSASIASHLRRRYPIASDPDALKEELKEKLDCAVSVGLIAKCGDDQYCIPTLRQQANSDKTALTAFWDTYYGSGLPPSKGQFLTLGLSRISRYKKITKITPKRGNDSGTDNYEDLVELDS